MERLRCLVTVPTYEQWIHADVAAVLLRMAADDRCSVEFSFPGYRPYENALNHAVHTMLRGTWDYWINIDDDNPPIKNPLDLCFLGKDIIGCPTPTWRNTKIDGPVQFSAYNLHDGHYFPFPKPSSENPLVQVDAVGTGCIVISRAVLTTLEKPLFVREWDTNGFVSKGSDLRFCEIAKRKGFEVFAHFGYPCRHYKELELCEVAVAYS